MNQTDLYINGQIGGTNSRMTAKFWWDCVIDADATKQAGREIYKDVPFVTLSCDGGKRQIPKRATPEIIEQYPDEYNAFENEVKRMPLWILHLKPYQIKDLEYFGIKCVEDFATNPCPAGFERFAKAAKIINQLSEENEIRSNRNIETQRQDLRTPQIQRVENNFSRGQTQKESQKESIQEINFNYSWQL